MSARAVCLVFVLAGCHVELGPVPFECATGACPSGYHCGTTNVCETGDPTMQQPMPMPQPW